MKSQLGSYPFSWFDRFCLWYPPGWLILFNRHWQHYYDDPDGWNWLEYALFLIPFGFYLALLLRWVRLGFRSPQSGAGISEFDSSYQMAFREEVLARIIEDYFQGKIHQIENLPDTGPLIIAMNHAGMSFPWDFLGLGYLLGASRRKWNLRVLANESLFEHPWVVWWLPPQWLKVLGGIQATGENFEEAIANQPILLYAPEGVRGPGKGWGERYQLNTFHPSFIQLSDRYKIPILPVVCLGNEFLHPWAINLQKWSSLVKLPFLPVSFLMIPFIFFPSMGVWAMKTRLSYYIQPVCDPNSTPLLAEAKSSKKSQPPKTARMATYQRAQELRSQLQSQINQRLNITTNSQKIEATEKTS